MMWNADFNLWLEREILEKGICQKKNKYSMQRPIFYRFSSFVVNYYLDIGF